jgi:hypothetical protein
VRESRSFAESERLARLLPYLNKLEPEHVKGLCEAFNSNRQVSESYAFNGGKRGTYGGGLPEHLRRITGSRYEVIGDPKRIELVGAA